MPATLLWLVIALPLAGFVANGLLALRRPGATGAVTAIGVGSVAAAFAVALGLVAGLRAAGGEPTVVPLWAWMHTGALRLDLALQLDPLTAVMLLVVTGVGTLIHVFSVGYMHGDPGYARYFAYLNLFVASMLTLVLGASLPVSFIGWEGVGLCSYLLIGFWHAEEANADAGKKAFLANRVGDFGVLVAMFLLWWHVGTLDYAALAERAPSALVAGGGVVTAITLLLLLGCTGKSAQIPLYVWLPDAMAGPTPVSALIHAATMVTAGVFLVVRLAALFAMAPLTSSIMAGIGVTTALLAALIALRQYDIKKVLAYSTISQLGFMFLAVGAGAYVAGLFHVVTHAFFKALLFLGAGSVIHAMHAALHAAHDHADPQDMRNMGGLRRALPWTAALMGLATLAIAGVPPLSGFFSKDEILAAAFGRGSELPAFRLYWAMGLLTAFLTAVYMARLFTMTFLGPSRVPEAGRSQLHDGPPSMTLPLVVLGLLAAAGGVLNLPAWAGGHHALDTWLAPIVERAAAMRPLELPHGSTEWALIGGAVAAGLAGLLLGWQATRRTPVVPAAQAAEDTGLWRLLHRKFYVDELYAAVIVRPIVALSRTVLWQGLDRGAIDGGAVRGLARSFQSLGWAGSRLQTGQLGFYVVVFVAGAVWVLRTVLD